MNRMAIGFALWLGILTLPVTGSADPAAEHVEWGRWALDYEVRENTGLTLRNVSYGGELVLGKASMPVVRVKYVKERESLHLVRVPRRQRPMRSLSRPAALAGSRPDRQLRGQQTLHRQRHRKRREVVGIGHLRANRRIPPVSGVASLRGWRDASRPP